MPSFGPQRHRCRAANGDARAACCCSTTRQDIRDAMTGLLRSARDRGCGPVDDEAAAARALAQRAAAEGRPYDLLLCDYRLADGVRRPRRRACG
jgi:hypothetical protein